MNLYIGVEAHDKLVQWFWEILSEFTNQERSLFLRFVWGRTRLPRTIEDFRGRDFVLNVSWKHFLIFKIFIYLFILNLILIISFSITISL